MALREICAIREYGTGRTETVTVRTTVSGTFFGPEISAPKAFPLILPDLQDTHRIKGLPAVRPYRLATPSKLSAKVKL